MQLVQALDDEPSRSLMPAPAGIVRWHERLALGPAADDLRPLIRRFRVESRSDAQLWTPPRHSPATAASTQNISVTEPNQPCTLAIAGR